MLSAIVLTHNEEENIKRCLQSLSFCDEIIVVDNQSTDKTVELAKKEKATVYSHAFKNDFAAQRNYAMEKAKGDWLLFVDADEVVPEKLQKEIVESIKSSQYVAYSISRQDIFWNTKLQYGETSKVLHEGLIRLMKKDAGKWIRPVHEVFETNGPVGHLQNILEHYPHQTVSEFLQDINFYSTLRARELQQAGKQATVFSLVAYPVGKFLYTYLILRGFQDGAAGFAYSFFLGFYSFLVRAKLIQYTEIDSQK